MATGRQIKTIRIDAETAKSIEAALAEIPDMDVGRHRKFTAREDAIILAAWDKKAKKDIAEYIGTSCDTLRRHYRDLTRGEG